MPDELTATLDELDDLDDGDQITVGELVQSFEHRGFGPLLLVPALVALIPPISGIPGVPAICGIIITLIAGQMIIGRKHPWLPKRLKELSVDSDKVEKMREKGRPAAKWVDSLSAERLSWLANPVSIRFIAALVVLLALSIIPLEIVPFGAAAPAGAIVLLSLGLVARDGVMIVGGCLLSVAVIWLVMTNL